MAIKALKYDSVRSLLEYELSNEEGTETKNLINSLKHVKKKKVFTKDELILMSNWKSYRQIHHIKENHHNTIKSVSQKALNSKSEKEKIDHLTSLNGVSIPVASAILTLIDPKNYGVIDIRVWQVLYSLNFVSTNPEGRNLNFSNWEQYLMLLRYYSKEFEVTARAIDRTLFYIHRKYQEGNLYKDNVDNF